MMKIVGGKWKGLYISTSKQMNYRPITTSLRTSFFNYLGSDIQDTVFMDGFAGTGILGFEALSRGASKAVFIEQNRAAVTLIKKNIQHLHAEDYCTILCAPIETIIRNPRDSQQFHIMFLDPPFSYPVKAIADLISSIATTTLLVPRSLLAVRYQKYSGILEPQIKEFHLIREFKESEANLGVYQLDS
jgi:16S rRNA (guanine966-N2)-methyltransferase